MFEKRPKGRFFAPDKLKNHTSEVKKGEKETARRKKGGEEKKSNGCTLSFFDGYLWPKKAILTEGVFGSNLLQKSG